MAKSRKKPDPSFDTATHAKLIAIGDYELAHDAGTCEVHFGPVLGPADGLPDFDVWWFLSGPDRTLPIPEDGLFALWERYHAAHAALCEDYRRLLFGLFSQSSQVGYDDAQWRFLRRGRPTERDVRAVVNSAELRLEQYQAKGQLAPVLEVLVSFTVSWDEHGVAVRLLDSGVGFALGEWSGIGDV